MGVSCVASERKIRPQDRRNQQKKSSPPTPLGSHAFPGLSQLGEKPSRELWVSHFFSSGWLPINCESGMSWGMSADPSKPQQVAPTMCWSIGICRDLQPACIAESKMPRTGRRKTGAKIKSVIAATQFSASKC